MIQPGNYVSDLLRRAPGDTVTAHGWVKTRRDGKNVHFIQLNDGSSPVDLQVVLDAGVVPPAVVASITTGACLSVEGELVASPGKGQAVELKARTLVVHGAADPEEYPLQKKKHNLETLRPLGHLRARTNTFGAVFRVRNALCRAIHQFFQERGFLYLHAPVISASDAEGAGSMFQVTTLDLDGLAKQSKPVDFEQDFFGKRTYLTVSGQLEAEIFAHAFANVYTFGPTFRAENSNTPRHLAEFYMIEPEMAFCNLQDNQDLAEAFLKSQVEQVLRDCRPDLEFLSKWYDPDLFKNLETLLANSFERISYTEAVALLQKAGRNWEFPVNWGADLQSEHERYLTEELFRKPVIVTGYPKEIKAFYMRSNDDGKTVAAMDVLVPRIGEIIGGSQREERHDVLLDKIRHHAERGMKEEAYWWYLDLRRFGGVEHAGFGMGFERMMMYLTGMKNIRDVIPFPRTPGSAEF
ncbi:MAG TPA: asparagine--tRNA ligase [Bryobacteraceae bacterium]|jgi:asparaginyl-tRNA synthetase|nr:asparagine--tRNA ligase [Bryobacteraceae bacterium]